MPKGAFRGMWKIISAGKHWRGYVKNLRKDGKFYWVIVYIQPKYDDKGKLIGFVAGRKISYKEAVKEASELYAKFHGDEHIDNEVFFNDGYDLYLKGSLS